MRKRSRGDAAAAIERLDPEHRADRVVHEGLVGADVFLERAGREARVEDGTERAEPEQVGEQLGVDPIALVGDLRAVRARIADHQMRALGLEQIVQPLSLGPLLEGHVEIRPETPYEPDQFVRRRRDDPAMHDLPLRVAQRVRRGCLMDVESEILHSCHAAHGARSFLAPLRRQLQFRSGERAFNMG